MEITEVRIKLTSGKNEKLRAFCSITIDNDFVIRDLKVIEGAKGAFVAMPSRKLMARCPHCSGKNHYRAPYCNECGARLSPEKLSLDGRRKLHADVAHPINSGCRESIQQHVLAHYEEEKEKSKDPNYRPVDLDDFDDDFFEEDGAVMAEEERGRWQRDDRAAAAAPAPSGAVAEREAEQVSRESPVEESEWEEETRDGARVEEREAEPAFGSARASGPRDDQSREDAGGSPGGPSRGSFQRGHDRERGGGRPARSRSRPGGRRRRGRDSRREGGRLGDRDRSREPGDAGRSSGGGERSRLAVDFDEMGPGHQRRSRRGDSGGRRDSARQGAGSANPREARAEEGRLGERRDEPSGEPRFRDRGRERGIDAPGSPDRKRLPEGRIPERRLAEETDVEPEDNFGAGLFS